MQSHTRRAVLAAGIAAAATGLSGCLAETSPADQNQTDGRLDVQSSFFVAGDFTRRVAGDAATVTDLVPFGQHGHGWEPGPDVQRAVVESDVVVYVGEEFQPWADNIVANLEQDAPAVSAIPIRHGVDLLPAPGANDGSDAHDGHDGHETGGNGTEEHGEEHHETNEDESEATEGDEDGHDHGVMDPHFWLDPTRAKQAVENVRAGLTEVDAESRDAYETNAKSFAADLDALDTEFEERLADRTRDVVLVAGHNAFQYLGNRYDFEVHALTGVAPDATPSPKAVREAQRVVEEHDLDHVLTPVFESDRAAQQLVAETDATTVLPLTPIPTVKPEWAERGWGYLDVMREVNLDSLSTALGAT
ncbi:metal ABC transporter substrate-binding protein [Halogranum rubrum]|nr:metal ABC transporter substrate-binding protein [Halogranum salarium]